MKDDINLLSPKAKQLRQRRLYLQRWGRLSVVVLAVLLVAVGGLALLWVLRSAELRSVNAELAKVEGGTGELEQQAREANRFVGAVAAKAEAQKLLMSRMEQLLAAVPGEVTLIALELTPEGTVVVEGIAPSATVLVSLQQSLEALNWVSDIEAPLQNFATATGGKFSLILTVAL